MPAQESPDEPDANEANEARYGRPPAEDVEAPAFLARRERPDEVPPDGSEPGPRPPSRPADGPPLDPDRGFFGPSPVVEPWVGVDESPPAPSSARSSQPGYRGPMSRREDDASEDPIANRSRPSGRDSGRRREDNPAWEPRRRMEAYPTLKTRMNLPAVNGLVLALVALLVAAVALFFVPMLLATKQPGGGGGSGTPAPTTAISSPAASPSAPAPSQRATVYTVRSGETLSRIAAKLGVSLDQLIAANPQLKDPNKLQIGDQLNVPTPAPSEVVAESPSPS